MSENMTTYCNGIAQGIGWVARALVLIPSVLLVAFVASVWTVNLPKAIGRFVHAYEQAIAESKPLGKTEPEKKLNCFDRHSFITGSKARECKPM